MVAEAFVATWFAAETATFVIVAATIAVNFAISMVVTRIFGAKPPNQTDNGMRQQIPPNTTNALPVVYGNAYLGGTFVDAVLSIDQKTMYDVLAISSISPNGQYTYDQEKFYYGGRLVTFDATDRTKVVSLIDQAGNIDVTISGNLYIYLYTSSAAGVITAVNSTTSPSTLMGGSDISVSQQWPSSGRQMNGIAFAIVKIIYNKTAQTTNLQPITFHVSHTLNSTGVAKAGDAWYDYMINVQYGCGVDPAYVDSASATALNTYGDQTIKYIPSVGPVVAATAITTGNTYTIAFGGTTDWVAIGATSDAVGETFVATGTGTGTGTAYSPLPIVNAGSLSIGSTYGIVTTGTTNWLAVGAASNAVGTMFTATAAGSGTGTATLALTQARYRFNGVLNAGNICLNNVDTMLSCCDSWMTYTMASGMWSVIINKASTAAYYFNDNNIIGEIKVSAVDLTSTVNQIEAKFPNKDNQDQPAYVVISTPTALLFNNEPLNKQSVSFDLVNDSVQASYLANRILEQAREDLIVSFSTTYVGIQVESGDVIAVTNADYGWNNQLFRVMKVSEASLPDGQLGATLEMSQYADGVYADSSITSFKPVPSSMLASPQFFSSLSAPTAGTLRPAASIPSFDINVSSPTTGRITYATIYYTTSATPTAADWITWVTLRTTTSNPYANGTSYVIKDITLPAGTYYFAFLVGDDGSQSQSPLSPKSAAIVWTPVGMVGQSASISGFTGFSLSSGTYTPATATLTALTQNITSPTYAWTITGATPSSGTASTITLTPTSTTTIGVSLTVSGSNLASPITQTLSMPIVAGGSNGNSYREAYYTQSQSLSAPSVSPNPTSGGTSFPTSVAWSGTITAPAGGQSLWAIDGIYNPTANSTSWSAPYLTQGFPTTIQSDNYVVNTSGWQIQRNTGNAYFNAISARGDITGASNITISGQAQFSGNNAGSSFPIIVQGTTYSLYYSAEGISPFAGATPSNSSNVGLLGIGVSTSGGTGSFNIGVVGLGYTGSGISNSIGGFFNGTTYSSYHQGDVYFDNTILYWNGIRVLGPPSTGGVNYYLRGDGTWALTSTITAGVASFNSRTGTVTLNSGDVTSALGYTPYDSSNPSGYITNSTSSLTNYSTTTTTLAYIAGYSSQFNANSGTATASSSQISLYGSTSTGIAGAYVGTTGSGNTVTFTVQVSSPSDIRLKEEITDSDLGLSFVKQLRPVSYKLKSDPKHQKGYGFIADEVEKLIELGSSLVYEEPNWQVGDEIGFKTIHYPSYIAILTKAIQEMSAEIAELKARFDAKNI
jgi:hypothetical protein